MRSILQESNIRSCAKIIWTDVNSNTLNDAELLHLLTIVNFQT
jgi:hypothetical protein